MLVVRDRQQMGDFKSSLKAGLKKVGAAGATAAGQVVNSELRKLLDSGGGAGGGGSGGGGGGGAFGLSTPVLVGGAAAAAVVLYLVLRR